VVGKDGIIAPRDSYLPRPRPARTTLWAFMYSFVDFLCDFIEDQQNRIVYSLVYYYPGMLSTI
jgi:hypothetical protein